MGGALLVVGIVAVAVALLEQQRNQDDTDSVEDPAGITYEVPTDWDLGESQAPLVVFERDDSRTATITHRPTDDPDAVGQLDDAGICEGESSLRANIDGADQVAECSNSSPERPQRAIGAVANGEFWVITVDPAASDAEGDDFIASIEFTTPG